MASWLRAHRGRPQERAAGAVLLAAVTAALAALVLPDLGVPSARPVLLVGSAWASVLAVVVGVLVHRPQRRRPWLALGVMLGCWALAQTGAVVGTLPGLGPSTGTGPWSGPAAGAEALMTAGQVVGAGLVARLFVRGRGRGRRAGAAPGPRVRGVDAGAVLDHVILLVTAALVVAQALALAVRDGTPGEVALGTSAAADVLLLALVLRFTVSRSGLPAATRVLVLGAVLSLGYHLAGTTTSLSTGPSGPLEAVAVAAFVLLGGAALTPSMPRALDVREHLPRRPASLRLLGLVPVVVAAPVLWFVTRSSAGAEGLPTGAFVCAGALLAALGMLRGVAALGASERAAEHDPLTGLRNRRGLGRAFDDRLADPDGLLLCLVDLDDFKGVNDTHGHEVGDELLVAVGAGLREAAGPDAVVARLGGDEFVVLLPAVPVPPAADGPVGDVGGAGPRRVHDATPGRLVAALQRPVRLGGQELRTSASVGVVHVVAPSSLPQALTRADIAMYEAKAAGKDGVTTYRPRMRTQVQRRQRLGEDLRLLLEGAPAARVGALVPHHQPLVLLETGEVVGSEALVRWHHPHLGLLPPVDFLGIAHDGGREADLDAHVLDAALAQVGAWLRAGLVPVPVSVNVTPASLLDGRLDVRVQRALRRHEVPAGLLRLEITEHEQVPASPEVVRVLRALSAEGVRLSLDDFGAGYTSLGYLQRFPVSLLKLDRSLVTAAEDGLGLLGGIAAMAQALELDVLAEGVETPDQRRLLVELGIRYGQGHLFSPALAAADMQALLRPAPPRPASGLPGPRRSDVGAVPPAGPRADLVAGG
ncbi:bifunctional diguanylate cyclase/phosphodiesterase [Pseudokineococcus basanitobsidens]|uniref:Bifunctional diguanylate cyclase/phosphodiesterase n=1 Tax=Pseudokineococcus basanitobsidens TaxID=1926649 RepID=A0ABU8RK87_9ACTN